MAKKPKEESLFAKLKNIKVTKQAKPAPKPQVPSDQSFAQAMHGVKPLKGNTFRLAKKTLVERDPAEDAAALAELKRLVSGEGNFHLDEQEPSGSAAGVNYNLLGRLKKGQFFYQKSLDLHGLLQDVAHDRVVHFVKEARLNDDRCVLIITGKGLGSPGGVGVLRDSLPHWLSTPPLNQHVLAFSPAKPKDGGPGAFYVLLRKR
jgi:DNA-nicking Smr family endonuclease